jgi:hypothetical protein
VRDGRARGAPDRAGDPARHAVEEREQRLEARVGERVDRLAAAAVGLHEARLAQTAQVVGELGQRHLELAGQPRHRRRAAMAETVDHPQPDGVRQLSQQGHAASFVVRLNLIARFSVA